MKKILLFLFALPLLLNAQDVSKVVTAENKSADELFTLSREWFAKSFNSANDVIQLEDEENKKLIGKGSVRSDFIANNIAVPVWLNFTITVQTKDGRYKYDIEDATYTIIETGKEIDVIDCKRASDNIEPDRKKNIKLKKMYMDNYNRFCKDIEKVGIWLENYILKNQDEDDW